MERVQILLEPEQKQMLKIIAKKEKRNFSDLVRSMLDNQIDHYKKSELANAARALLDDYTTDEELTVFTNLDGEDFHA